MSKTMMGIQAAPVREPAAQTVTMILPNCSFDSRRR
jgi:hypothetical protein